MTTYLHTKRLEESAGVAQNDASCARITRLSGKRTTFLVVSPVRLRSGHHQCIQTPTRAADGDPSDLVSELLPCEERRAGGSGHEPYKSQKMPRAARSVPRDRADAPYSKPRRRYGRWGHPRRRHLGGDVVTAGLHDEGGSLYLKICQARTTPCVAGTSRCVVYDLLSRVLRCV